VEGVRVLLVVGPAVGRGGGLEGPTTQLLGLDRRRGVEVRAVEEELGERPVEEEVGAGAEEVLELPLERRGWKPRGPG